MNTQLTVDHLLGLQRACAQRPGFICSVLVYDKHDVQVSAWRPGTADEVPGAGLFHVDDPDRLERFCAKHSIRFYGLVDDSSIAAEEQRMLDAAEDRWTNRSC